MEDKKVFTRVTTVQDLIAKEIFSEGQNNNNEMLELLDFMKDNSVPLTDDQVESWFLLSECGLQDIALYMNNIRPMLTPQKSYFDLINKITLADRIKGTAKMKDILKAQVPSAAQVPSSELQPKALKEKELGR